MQCRGQSACTGWGFAVAGGETAILAPGMGAGDEALGVGWVSGGHTGGCSGVGAGTQMLSDLSGGSSAITWYYNSEEVMLKLKTGRILSVRGRESCSKCLGCLGPVRVDLRQTSQCPGQMVRGLLTLQ